MKKERHLLLGLGDVCIKLSSMTPTPPSMADIASMWYVMFRSGYLLIAYLHGKKKEAGRMQLSECQTVSANPCWIPEI